MNFDTLKRLLPAVIFLCVAAACTGTATDIPLPTLAQMSTDESIPPEVQATSLASQITPTPNLQQVAVNDIVSFEGTITYDAATSLVTVQTDDGTIITLVIPPPLAESFNGQRVQGMGQVTAVGENLTLSVDNLSLVGDDTLSPEATAELMPPPDIGVENAPDAFTITPNLTALESYDAVVEAQGDALQGYELLSISSEVGVWKISFYNAAENTLYEMVLAPDGTVQPQITIAAMPDFIEVVPTINRAQLTIDSDDFLALLQENEINTPLYTLILSPSGADSAAWVAISDTSTTLLTVDAETGEVVP